MRPSCAGPHPQRARLGRTNSRSAQASSPQPGSQAGLGVTPPGTPLPRRPLAAFPLPPLLPPGPGCTPGLLETSKTSLSLPPSSLGVPSKGSPEPTAAAKFPRSPSATKSSRACSGSSSSRGGRYPRAQSRLRCSISRRGRGGGGGPGAERWRWQQRGLRLQAPARARTPRSLPWSRTAPPPLAAGGRQSVQLPGLPARHRSGGGRRRRGPAGRLLAIGQCPPSVRLSTGRWGWWWREFAVQSLPHGPGRRRGPAAPGPIPGRGSVRLGAASFCLRVSWLGSRLPPPRGSPAAAPAGFSAALSARRVGAQPRRADLASDPAQRGESGSGVADPEPKKGEERGEGRGEKGGGGQWLGAEPPPPLHHPSPPFPSPAPAPPRSAPPPSAGVAWRDHQLPGWSATPPRTRFAWREGGRPPT
jgi:hypothetical protein